MSARGSSSVGLVSDRGRRTNDLPDVLAALTPHPRRRFPPGCFPVHRTPQAPHGTHLSSDHHGQDRKRCIN